ncbi:MAG: pyridoxal 5'-phosphate synthase glutaminase subunit PdxT [Methanomicrobiales archaeon]|nr:pyridoxal 5'-phosphate synthase glutaminase subunit PdxT [Methanomicrobiales archaeon]
MGVRIGVLDLQGDVSEHIEAFRRALAESGLSGGSEVIPIRRADQIASLDGLAIPGGESTTISKLIDKNGMRAPLEEFRGGIFATCAGLIVMAKEVPDPRVKPLGLLDIDVERNAFGRQKDSFEADLPIKGLDSPFHAVFIRAPVISRIGKGVEVLAEVEEAPVAVRQGKHLGLSFHPELSGDTRLHRMFLGDL